VPPGWEVTWFGRTWALGLLVPLVVVGVFLLVVAAYPFVEERLTGDRRTHHTPERPRDAPRRTGIGVAGIVFYATLWAAAGTDVIATHLHVTVETQVYLLRAALVVGPFLAYDLTSRICLGLQARDREVREHGPETGILRRTVDGGYVAVPAPAGQRRPLETADARSSDVHVRG
jgi:ubiquinol-cytochrome c reductase cytochrome b subunit